MSDRRSVEYAGQTLENPTSEGRVVDGPGSLPGGQSKGALRIADGLEEGAAAATLRRFASDVLPVELHLGEPQSGGFIYGSDLVKGGRELENALLNRRRVYLGSDVVFACVSLLSDALVLAASPIAAVFAERRAIDLSAAHVAVRFEPEPAVAVIDPQLAVLPDDRAAEHDSVEIVEDLDGLLDRVVSTFFGQFASYFVDALRESTHASRQTLWAMAGSAVATASSYAAMVRPDVEILQGEIWGLFERAGGMVEKAAPRPMLVECSDGRALSHVRRTCCLFHQLPDADYCGIFPLVSDDMRRGRACRDLRESSGMGSQG